MNRFKNIYHSILLVGIAIIIVGCSGKTIKKTPTPIFETAKRQLAPEPVYNRLRWVHLPEVLPEKRTGSKAASSSIRINKSNTMIFPVIHFELKNGTLAEASQMLGASARYKSSCDASIAEKHITLVALGTIHELANKISDLGGIEVIIDHAGREVRFVPRNSENKLRFFDNTVSEYEHRSVN
ncbi:MAG: hypothetical protein SGJ02_14200 [bacterium]|nr:hypothetical protein [bacterium]